MKYADKAYFNFDINLLKYVQFFAYKMTEASENPMLKQRNVDLNTVSLKASDCTFLILLNI
jgi:hypothetical protein